MGATVLPSLVVLFASRPHCPLRPPIPFAGRTPLTHSHQLCLFESGVTRNSIEAGRQTQTHTRHLHARTPSNLPPPPGTLIASLERGARPPLPPSRRSPGLVMTIG